MSDNEWPYARDGVQRDEFAERLRLPLVSTPYPRWFYITAIVVAPAETILGWRGVRPTDAELCAVASYHEEYCSRWYTQEWRDRMAQRPFDVDGGACGRILIKYPHGGWGYRRASWQSGPCFVPGPCDGSSSLLQVLDREQSIVDESNGRWLRWVIDHPDVFESLGG